MIESFPVTFHGHWIYWARLLIARSRALRNDLAEAISQVETLPPREAERLRVAFTMALSENWASFNIVENEFFNEAMASLDAESEVMDDLSDAREQLALVYEGPGAISRIRPATEAGLTFARNHWSTMLQWMVDEGYTAEAEVPWLTNVQARWLV